MPESATWSCGKCLAASLAHTKDQRTWRKWPTKADCHGLTNLSQQVSAGQRGCRFFSDRLDNIQVLISTSMIQESQAKTRKHLQSTYYTVTATFQTQTVWDWEALQALEYLSLNPCPSQHQLLCNHFINSLELRSERRCQGLHRRWDFHGVICCHLKGVLQTRHCIVRWLLLTVHSTMDCFAAQAMQQVAHAPGDLALNNDWQRRHIQICFKTSRKFSLNYSLYSRYYSTIACRPIGKPGNKQF